MDIAAHRTDLAQRMQWGVGFWLAGFLFWAYAALVGAFMPFEAAREFWFFGSCAIAPMGFLASWIFGADAMARTNPLAKLTTAAHLSAGAMAMPLMFAAFLFYPKVLLLIMAICLGIDFFVMAWAYDTRFPAVHAVIRTISVSVIWFALPQSRDILLPGTVALLYLLTVLFILWERPRWLQRHGAPA